MINLTVREFAEIVHGTIHQVSPEMVLDQNPVIDSRLVNDKTFFVAFRGEKVDGHEFAAEAITKGAKIVLAARDMGLPAVVVANTGEALAQLARYVRDKLSNLTVIGITGSQGKTTTKDLLGHMLSIVAPTVAPAGNLNNEIGVPLTLLRCDETTRYCIVEMGARHVGDIAALVEIARPNVGVVLNVGRAHIGEFGSRDLIAQAKSELITGLDSTATAVLGDYDEYTPNMAKALPNRVIHFGEKSSCDVRAADIEFREGRAHFDLVTPAGRQAVGLQLLGLHQIPNALAAAAVATVLEIPIESIAAALSTAEASSKWRMELHEANGILLINDAYNANPESMSAALRTLVLLAQERGGQSWAFLGKMNELGESTALEHQLIGRLVSDIGVDHLVAVGTDLFDLTVTEHVAGGGGDEVATKMGEETTMHKYSNIDAAAVLSQFFAPGDVILVKASRSEHLDDLATRLMAPWIGPTS
ncbi:MAG: UDP-N-acetylmuramoyl-tripeptide--D-alanyl-D-alanine ligase [Actinomycetes bacterium]